MRVPLAAAAAMGFLVLARPSPHAAGEEGDDYDHEAERLKHGIPCPEAMPGGAPWPIKGTCFEHSAESLPALELVFWMTSPRDAEYYDPAGVVIEDCRFPKRPALAVDLDAVSECDVWLEDFSKEGVPDVVISCPA